MTDPGHAASLWTDRSFLRDVQYKTDVNLAARQSIYAYHAAADRPGPRDTQPGRAERP